MNSTSSALRLCLLALAPQLSAQGLDSSPRAESDRTRPRAAGGVAERLLQQAPTAAAERVAFDVPGDGRIWAAGATYKASFGADGFVYVPFFGSQAPRNYPVQFVLRSVRVGRRDLGTAAAATPTRKDSRVTFDRGPLREVYDLLPRSVEQTFVVDGDLPGDVDVEMEVVSELNEDPAREGVQFGNELGQVEYGTAWVVTGATRSEIPATMAGRLLRLHVPAAQRGIGPVVIDPIISTRMLAETQRAQGAADVAYDATTDRWLVTWVNVFSAADHDVVAELRTASGDPVSGGLKFIDTTSQSFTYPRVANLNAADRFLVAMERVPASTSERYSIWGRTVDAPAPFGMSAVFEITPRSSGNQQGVDVGGDPGTGTRWTVVWMFEGAVYARQINFDGAVLQGLIPVMGTGTNSGAQISLSNGNGQIPTPCWCIVFSHDADVYAATLALNGTFLATASRIDRAGGAVDLSPSISSPMMHVSGRAGFLVSWVRQSSPPEMIVQLVDAATNTIVPEVNLSRRYGYSGLWCQVESDGCRFAATCQVGTSLRIGTLAGVHNDILQHEALQDLGTSEGPSLASKRSGGGGATDYAVAYGLAHLSPSRVALGIYQGRASSGGFNTRLTNCGLTIAASGRPFLGDTVQFSLGNAGSEIAGLLLGVPMPEVQVCGSCRLGLDPASSLIPFASPLALPLPSDPLLVGITLAVQGFAVGTGTCGGLRLSDTIDFTIQ